MLHRGQTAAWLGVYNFVIHNSIFNVILANMRPVILRTRTAMASPVYRHTASHKNIMYSSPIFHRYKRSAFREWPVSELGSSHMHLNMRWRVKMRYRVRICCPL